MSLSTRLTTAMVFLVVLTASTVGYLSYRNIEAAFLPAELSRLASRAQMQAVALNAHMSSARADVLSGMGPASLEGFIAAHNAHGTDPRDGTPESVWRDRLAKNFAAQLETKPDYSSFRIVGIENGGRELIRVDRNGPGGSVRVASDADLQPRGDREFFAATSKLKQGEVYFSPITLRPATPGSQLPRIPFLRAASPVFSPDGKLFGIIIINVDMRTALAEVALSVRPGGQAFVVNEDGDYLLHPDKGREFGFDLGQRYRIQSDFPELADDLASHAMFSGMVKDAKGQDFAVALNPVLLAGGRLVTVIEAVPSDVAMASADGVRQATIFGGLAAMLAATALAVILARSLTRPLMQMTRSLSGFTGKEEVSMPVRASGEIGALARAFDRMAAAVRETTAALQREILDRTRIEERERLYVAAVESASDAIVTTTINGIITTWNGGAEHLFGYSAKEAIGQSIGIIATEQQRLEQLAHEARIRRSERVEDLETARRAKDGTLRDVSLTFSPIADANGIPVSAVAIYRDIGPRKLAEERFRLAVEASPGAMIMADRNGIIQLVNGEAERMFGYERGELLGKPVEALIPLKQRAAHEQDRADYAAKPAQRNMGKGRDLFGVRKDGSEVAVEIGLNPIVGREGMMVMASIVDVTERKANETLLRERAEELQRSNAELEQFAYVASHDLQEPLRMVASYAELLAERYQGKLDAKADKYIGYAVDGAKRMQRLVNDLLAFSRAGRQQASSEPADLNRVVQEVLTGLERAIAQAKAAVEVGPLPVAAADAGQIAQVFQNLIGNAVKFRGERAPVVRVAAVPFGSGWKFSVADNGIGIDPQYSDRIFQMFQRLHDRASYEGNGIGLPIAKKIVERYGGRIWFESVPGEGTTFFFTLPQIQEKAA